MVLFRFYRMSLYFLVLIVDIIMEGFLWLSNRVGNKYEISF